jgi:lysozyme
MKHPRMVIAALSLSAAAFGGIALKEGYSTQAIIPVPGDRPTIGLGSTFDERGNPVRMGDVITPPQAIARSLAHIAKDETAMKACVTAPLTQGEYDAYVSLVYNIGADAFCRSTLVRLLNAGNYQAACDQILRWDRFQGKPLRGLTIRRQVEHKKCMAAQ